MHQPLPCTELTGTVFARWNNGAGTPVGVVGNARGGSCGCDNRTPATPEERGTLEGLCLLNCIRFAAASGVRVINLSWGSTQPQRAGPDNEERRAITAFCNTGGIVAVAAMNEGSNILAPGAFTYPAALAADLQSEYKPTSAALPGMLPPCQMAAVTKPAHPDTMESAQIRPATRFQAALLPVQAHDITLHVLSYSAVQ